MYHKGGPLARQFRHGGHHYPLASIRRGYRVRVHDSLMFGVWFLGPSVRLTSCLSYGCVAAGSSKERLTKA